jgi:hypothetical protein
MGGKRQAGEIACEDTSVVNFLGGFHARTFDYERHSPGHEAFSLSQGKEMLEADKGRFS